MGRYIYILLVVFAFVLGACEQQYFYTQKTMEGLWLFSDPFIVQFDQQDTTGRYDMHLILHHSTEYQYQNLYLKSISVFPGQDTVKDIFSIDIADKFGNWQGECAGSSCSLDVPILQRTKFRKAGAYEIYFYQHSRTDSLIGIEGMEFWLEEVE